MPSTPENAAIELSSKSKYNAASRLLQNLSNAQILVLSIFFMAPGIGLAIGIDKPTLFVKLLIALITEIGFAFFIAWVIICTVDEREKLRAELRHQHHSDELERQRREADRRLHSKLYLSHIAGLELPPSISEEIHHYIATSYFLKRSQNITYNIEAIGGYTRLRQTLEAYYENVDDKPRTFRSPFDSYDNDEKSIELQFPDVDWGLIYAEVKTRKVNTKQWNLAFSFNKTDKTQRDLFFEVELDPGDFLSVVIEYSSAKFGNDNEIFTNKSLCERLEAEIVYDKNQFTVDYRDLHPRPNSLDISRRLNTDRLRSIYPYLPSNGFVTWWSRKDNGAKI